MLRGFSRLLQESNLFVLLAATGLLVQFGLQAVINMASSLHLIPTKGMTLPFLSYGGSSMLALALGMGMMLALTRRRLGGRRAVSRGLSSSPPAAPAGICSRPRRWRAALLARRRRGASADRPPRPTPSPSAVPGVDDRTACAPAGLAAGRCTRLTALG